MSKHCFHYIVNPNIPYGDIPEIFRPVKEFRGGRTIITKADRRFTVLEKNWLCGELLGTNLDCDGNPRPAQQQTALVKKYQLCSSFFNDNMPSYEKNKGTTNSVGGQERLHPQDLEIVSRQVIKRRQECNEPSIYEVTDMIQDAKRQRTLDVDSENFLGLPDPVKDKDVCARTIQRYMRKYFLIVKPNNVASTDARVKATGDPFMSYAWYIVNLAYSAHLPGTNKWNADGTTFTLCPKGKVNEVVRLSMEDEHYYLLGEEDKSKKAIKYSGQARRLEGAGFDFAIKIMHLCNAAGRMGPIVAIIAIDGLEADEFHHEKVYEFSNTDAMNQFGYVYFTATRAGNKAMWKHYLQNILVDVITSEGNTHDTHSLGYFVSTDSEDIIISQAFEDTVSKSLVDNQIAYARIGASLTSIHQASDRQRTFLETKRFVKNAHKSSQKFPGSNHFTTRKNLAAAFLNLQTKYPNASVPNEIECKMINALVTIGEAFKHVAKPQMIRDGFIICGQHVAGGSISTSSSNSNTNSTSISFATIMAQCKTHIEVDQLRLMKSKAPLFVEYVKQRGTITYSEICAAGILPVEGFTMDRSESAHVHHWAEVVTHPSTVASYLEEKRAKAPEVIELRRAEKLIEREMVNNMRKVAKKSQAEATKAQKQIDQEAEKLYIQSLSPEDKKRVKENKRIANQEKKEQAKLKKVEKLERAIAIAPEYALKNLALLNVLHLNS